MSTAAKALIRFKFTDQKQLTTLLSALTPETCATESRRAKVHLRKDDDFLVLSVEAQDTTALRAAVNAYLRWIQSTLKIIEVVENQAC